MKTLNKQITQTFFTEPNGREILISNWKLKCNLGKDCDLDAVDHLLYLALLGKDYRKGFDKIKKETWIRIREIAFSRLLRSDLFKICNDSLFEYLPIEFGEYDVPLSIH